ncbi:LppU/SCO3897 family protein [Kitasatospora terrestris]|uniref:Toxin-antitoxin system, toxin component n=1 Tax=Kitasatospora terrestris TaxID=258051 RepID=A0ABP9DSQ9_9ACTN
MSTPPQSPYGATPPPAPNPYATGAPVPPQPGYGATPPQAPPPLAYGVPGQADPQQQAYGAMPGQAFGQPAPGFGGMPQPGYGPSCRFCGGMPAVDATIRGHQGLIVIMKFLKLQGPFCRTCGIAAHRDMTAKSLLQGWWGIGSAIINPITMLINLPQRAKINKLPEPAPGAPGMPMNPGKPLLQRPAALGFLLPIIALVLIIVAAVNAPTTPRSAAVGDCVHNRHVAASDSGDDHPDVVVLPCSDPKAEARIVGKVDGTANAETACKKFADADGYYTEERGSRKYTLCLHFTK